MRCCNATDLCGRFLRGDRSLSTLAFGHRLRRLAALTGIYRPALWPPRVRRQNLCQFWRRRRIGADSDRRPHLPADGITTPFCISVRSTATVRGTSLSAGNTNGDTMILARCGLDYPLDPHLDLPSGRKVVFVEKPLRGTEPEQRQWHGSGILAEVWPADIGNAVISAMDAKAVQMIVIPPHEDLDHPVQLGNR